jgi:1-acyl-sn-glycerol-3-phosphate acyltransferase
VANALRLAALALVTAFYGIPSTVAIFLVPGARRKRAIYRFISRGYCDKVLRLSGVSFRVEGMEKVDPTRPYVIVANHQSHFDPPILIRTFSQPLYFVLKKELLSVPFLGPTLRVSGQVAVDRGAGREAAESLLKGVRGLTETGGNGCLAVFPEGTRSRDGRLLPFRRGAFHAALMTRWPVLPVRIEGSRELLPPDTTVVRGGKVAVFVGDPIPTEALKAADLPALAETVRAFLAGEEAARPSSPSVTPSDAPSSAPPGHGGTRGPA